MEDKLIANIDGDIIHYRYGFTVNQVVSFDEVAYGLDEYMKQVLLAQPISHYRAFLTGNFNFRNSVEGLDKKYKGNRDDRVKPVWHNQIKEHLISKWKFIVVDYIEADDALAMCASGSDIDIIYTTDKDLKTIPGRHYNFVTDTFTIIDAQEANFNFWCQMLKGDPGDNVTGIPKIGPKKACAMLEGLKPFEMQEVVMRHYKNYFGHDLGITRFNATKKVLKMLDPYTYLELFGKPFDVVEPVELFEMINI